MSDIYIKFVEYIRLLNLSSNLNLKNLLFSNKYFKNEIIVNIYLFSSCFSVTT